MNPNQHMMKLSQQFDAMIKLVPQMHLYAIEPTTDITSKYSEKTSQMLSKWVQDLEQQHQPQPPTSPTIIKTTPLTLPKSTLSPHSITAYTIPRFSQQQQQQQQEPSIVISDIEFPYSVLTTQRQIDSPSLQDEQNNTEDFYYSILVEHILRGVEVGWNFPDMSHLLLPNAESCPFKTFEVDAVFKAYDGNDVNRYKKSLLKLNGTAPGHCPSPITTKAVNEGPDLAFYQGRAIQEAKVFENDHDTATSMKEFGENVKLLTVGHSAIYFTQNGFGGADAIAFIKSNNNLYPLVM